MHLAYPPMPYSVPNIYLLYHQRYITDLHQHFPILKQLNDAAQLSLDRPATFTPQYLQPLSPPPTQ
jgi:hypothetical protein